MACNVSDLLQRLMYLFGIDPLLSLRYCIAGIAILLVCIIIASAFRSSFLLEHVVLRLLLLGLDRLPA